MLRKIKWDKQEEIVNVKSQRLPLRRKTCRFLIIAQQMHPLRPIGAFEGSGRSQPLNLKFNNLSWEGGDSLALNIKNLP